MPPTTPQTEPEVLPTRLVPTIEPGARPARRRLQGLVALGIASVLGVAAAGCPAPATTEPPPKAPPPPISQPERDRCAGDAGSRADCQPEGCTEALAPDAAVNDEPEPNCDALLAD